MKMEINSIYNENCIATLERMAERELLLVFITTKTGEPVATAEIKPDGTLGQFYADEDADDIKPTAKAQKALDAWMDKFKPNWKEVA